MSARCQLGGCICQHVTQCLQDSPGERPLGIEDFRF